MFDRVFFSGRAFEFAFSKLDFQVLNLSKDLSAG
jgi:hypothetical protein